MSCVGAVRYTLMKRYKWNKWWAPCLSWGDCGNGCKCSQSPTNSRRWWWRVLLNLKTWTLKTRVCALALCLCLYVLYVTHFEAMCIGLVGFSGIPARNSFPKWADTKERKEGIPAGKRKIPLSGRNSGYFPAGMGSFWRKGICRNSSIFSSKGIPCWNSFYFPPKICRNFLFQEEFLHSSKEFLLMLLKLKHVVAICSGIWMPNC